MEEAELRKHRCCFTGHRPDKMTLGENDIKPLLEKAIDKAIEDGYVTFITGMAMGTDVWAAEVVLEKKTTLEKLADEVVIYPQLLKNLRVTSKERILSDQRLTERIRHWEDTLGDKGRILVRASGTEPLIRVMAEAETEALCQKTVDDLLSVVEEIENEVKGA